jgi:hypothetical protein
MKQSYYYSSSTMQQIIKALVSQGFAKQITGGVYSPDDGDYEFSLCRQHKTGGGSTHWTERSRDETLITLSQDNESGVYNEAKQVIETILASLADGGVVNFIEDHVRNRGGKEELPIHACIIQVAVSFALGSVMQRDPSAELHLNGNFKLIGRLPHGNLVINGNVDTIEGGTGQLLVINGDVKHLGCGPFWNVNPASGVSGKIVVNGSLVGYKTSIANPDLEIEILGDVTAEGAFLYRSCVFKSMLIHGNLWTETSICPGLYEGGVTVLGEAPHLEKYLKQEFHRSSGSTHGHGNIWLKGTRLLQNGRVL